MPELEHGQWSLNPGLCLHAGSRRSICLNSIDFSQKQLERRVQTNDRDIKNRKRSKSSRTIETPLISLIQAISNKKTRNTAEATCNKQSAMRQPQSNRYSERGQATRWRVRRTVLYSTSYPSSQCGQILSKGSQVFRYRKI